MRGTPLMLQMMVVFYGPNLLLGISVPKNWRFLAVIIAFIINYAAYFAEIYRSGIESIPVGQYEAAPALCNEFIMITKDTSLASVIGTVEMFTKAKQIAVAPRSPGMVTFAMAGLFYYVFNYLVAFLMNRLEKAFDYYKI